MAEILITIPEGLSERLDKALALAAPEQAALSRSRLARLIAEGAVRGPSGPVTDGKARAETGDYLVEIGAPEPLDAQPEPIPLSIAYEDGDLIVVDKPAGMVVHPAPGAPNGTLVNALLAHCAGSLSGIGGAARPGIVHRIDKETSGLLVVAKTDRAHQGLARQFADHTARRRYLAVAHGMIDPADARLRGLPGVGFEPGGVLRIATLIGRHPGDRQRQAVSFQNGRHAVTRARVIETFGTPPAAMLVECRLETGRTHQIRVHMAHIGHPLVSDLLYAPGFATKVNKLPAEIAEAVQALGRQALHAAELGFEHPTTGEEMLFSAELPEDLQALEDALAPYDQVTRRG